MCGIIAIFNAMCGCNILNIYAYTIFNKIVEDGNDMKLTPTQCTYFIGTSGFIGSFLSNFIVGLLKMRPIMIGGEILICIFLFLVGIFIT